MQAGEIIEWVAARLGLAASENIGLRRFVRMLKDAYPDLPCEYYEVRRPYRYVGA